MNNPKNRADRTTFIKLTVIFALFAILAACIVGRLAEYQIDMFDYYQTKVLNQITYQNEVTPERGNILDRNGNILASNKTVYNVILSPADIQETMKYNNKVNSDSKDDNDVLYEYEDAEYGIHYKGIYLDDLIAEVLSKYLEVDKSFILEKTALEKRRYEVIKKNVEADLESRIEDFISKFNLKKHVYFDPSSKRYYPMSTLACHVIGFTNTEGKGIYGLESYYNSVLEGTYGRYIQAQDGRNRDLPFEYEHYIEAGMRQNIVTTLDIYIQYELENQLEKTFWESGAGNRVTGIVMDVNTGGILAMATYPAFDLNDPYTIDSYSMDQLAKLGYAEDSEEYKAKYTELMYSMWNNKAITETYEPGSTFKIVTTAMALEEKEVRTEEMFYCGGSLKVEGWSKPISCHLHSGHGSVTFRVGLQQSCNPVLMTIAQRVGKERFYNYFDAFGYMGKTGIDLPGELSGLYAPFKDFSTVSLAVYSFGQTFKTTPIQQIRAISSVANGGTLLTPHLLKEITDDSGNVIQSYKTDEVRRVVSTETCETITDILEEGVAGDGGAKNAYVNGYRVAAKTGTSEKRDERDENGNTPFRVGSTVAFAPADDPQISAIIIVDKPLNGIVYGSTVAAPYISNLLSYVLPYIGVEAHYDDSELMVNVPTCTGLQRDAAAASLDSLNVKYEIRGNGDKISAQIPDAGYSISRNDGFVILYTDGELPQPEIEVPELKGMTAYNANAVAVSRGLNVDFKGSTNSSTATVVSQSPEAGTYVAKGTIIEIEMRHLDGTD